MKSNKLYIVILAVIVAAVAIFVIPSIFSRDDTNPPEPTAADSSETDDERNRETALEAARIMTTWDPANDFNRTAAEDRTSHLMTDERATNIVPPERAASGEEWHHAAEHQATSKPHVTVNPYTDTQDTVLSVRATWEWVTENGETLRDSDEERIYYFSFTNEGKIHDYTYETVRATPKKTTDQ